MNDARDIYKNIINEIEMLFGQREFHKTQYIELLRSILLYKYLCEKYKMHIEEYKEDNDINESYNEIFEDDILFNQFKVYLYQNVGYIIEPGNFYEDFIVEEDILKFELLYFEQALIKFTESRYEFENMNIKDKVVNIDVDGLFSHINLNSTILGQKLQDRKETLYLILISINKATQDINLELYSDIFKLSLNETRFIISSFSSNKKHVLAESIEQDFPLNIAMMISEGLIPKKKYNNLYVPFEKNGVPSAYIAENNDIMKIQSETWNDLEHNISRQNYLIHGINNINIKNRGLFNLDYGIKYIKDKVDLIYADFMKIRSVRDIKKYDENNMYAENHTLLKEKKAELLLKYIDMMSDDGIMIVVSDRSFYNSLDDELCDSIFSDQNVVDCIIDLPTNVLGERYTNPRITILNKNRYEDDKILLIDATRNYIASEKYNEISDRHISKIVSIYKSKEDHPGFSAIVEPNQLQTDFGWNWEMSDFITPIIYQEYVDPKQVKLDLERLDTEISNDLERVKKHIKELNIF
ncbi:N-6 DNA methylase [Abyssicoccus albus]|uniref:site-specific DNA-methyltransferase (adenine-specific) n=1 Tax=Abyssicoccus albus TaxID=1817405 RepID=A0A3N5C6T6_9BACL|nr:N-6 DNA methylase [Abyssicoccus albus]RPF55172.1 type I restriction-modification system DNA methylase subunit [Abyssicoccus albus]